MFGSLNSHTPTRFLTFVRVAHLLFFSLSPYVLRFVRCGPPIFSQTSPAVPTKGVLCDGSFCPQLSFFWVPSERRFIAQTVSQSSVTFNFRNQVIFYVNDYTSPLEAILGRETFGPALLLTLFFKLGSLRVILPPCTTTHLICGASPQPRLFSPFVFRGG